MSEEESGEQMEAAAPVETGQLDSQVAVAPQESKTVPIEALQAEREHRQQLQEQIKVQNDHMSLMQSQQQRQAYDPPKEERSRLNDEDVMTYGEYKRDISNIEQKYKHSLKELAVGQKYSDYKEVVTKHLPDVIKQNPSIRNTLESTQDYELAYHLAKNSDSYRDTQRKVKQSADAEKIIQNSQKSGSLASVGSPSPISTAKRYRTMSDSEFQKEVSKNMGVY